ncbi:uncharacterized protein N7482_009048 [Penicillium canariense]|uniref:Rhodopsin domain-containing protein n=1 Tax=Penicillium canariense TaxID=189055 RepID=A0A9W9LFX6_9EURO|nr:uncharacterized protein N7482_009048 [Penicillium canariense]KAJ5152570.1 hypothetical protein N7482_009048 [Penicillium canariense]
MKWARLIHFDRSIQERYGRKTGRDETPPRWTQVRRSGLCISSGTGASGRSTRINTEMPPPADHWRDVLIILPIVATTVATGIFVLRLYARYLVVHGLRIEDLLMGMGLLCTYGYATYVVYCMIWVLPREQRLRITLVIDFYLKGLKIILTGPNQAQWISQKFWPPAQVFVKGSIVLFLRRILGCVARFRQVATGVIIFVIIWGVVALIGNTFQCWPVQYFWIKHIEGHCMVDRIPISLLWGPFQWQKMWLSSASPCR